MGPAIGFTIWAAYNAEPGVAGASGEDVADVAFCPAVAKAETGTFHFVVNAIRRLWRRRISHNRR